MLAHVTWIYDLCSLICAAVTHLINNPHSTSVLIQSYFIWPARVMGLRSISHPSSALLSGVTWSLTDWWCALTVLRLLFWVNMIGRCSDWIVRGEVTAVSFPAAVGPSCGLFIGAAIHHGPTGPGLSAKGQALSISIWWGRGQNPDCQALIRRHHDLFAIKSAFWQVLASLAFSLCDYKYTQQACFIIKFSKNP